MGKAPHIIIAWAVPVSLQMLGARLEAYVRNKDSVIFRLCSQKVPFLPPEIWRNIGEQAEQSDYEVCLRWWQAADDCCRRRCQCGHDIMNDAHEERVDRLIGKVGQRTWTLAFSDYLKVFEDDFGLQIRFDVHRDLDSEDNTRRTILAHIILPIDSSWVEYSSDLDRKYPHFSIFTSMIIDPAQRPEPTPDIKERFIVALKTLHLQPMLHEIQEQEQEQEHSREGLQAIGVFADGPSFIAYRLAEADDTVIRIVILRDTVVLPVAPRIRASRTIEGSISSSLIRARALSADVEVEF